MDLLEEETIVNHQQDNEIKQIPIEETNINVEQSQEEQQPQHQQEEQLLEEDIQSRKIRKWKEEFNQLLLKEVNNGYIVNMEYVQSMSKGHGIFESDSTTRGIMWRLWLGCLDQDSTELWVEKTNRLRKRYDTLKKSHIVNPRSSDSATTSTQEKKSSSSNVNSMFDDPLSTDKNSIWNQFFENEGTQKEIGHDISRTYPGISFFERLDIQDSMTRILFIFSKQYPKIKYIQGMNEIVAPILYVLYHDSHWFDDRDVYQPVDLDHYTPQEKQPPRPDDAEYPQNPVPYPIDDISENLGTFLRNPEFFEHDSYFLFESLMNVIGKWFKSPPSKELPPPRVTGKYKEIYDLSEKEASEQAVNLVVVDECIKMFADIQYIEPVLYNYLKELSIEPHLYALRWIRILLAQVFPLSSLLGIWDSLFKDQVTNLLNYICISMLLNIKDRIIGRDYSECLQVLFHYPIHIQDHYSLITQAYQIRDRIAILKKDANGQSPTRDLVQKSSPPQLMRPRVYPSSFTQSIQPPKSNIVTTNSTPPSTSSSPSIPTSQTGINGNSTPPLSQSASLNNSNNSISYNTGYNTSGLLSSISSTVTSTLKQIINNLNVDMEPNIKEIEHNQNHVSKRLERLVYTLETIRTPENSETIQSVQEELKLIKNLISPTTVPTGQNRPTSPKLTTNTVVHKPQPQRTQQPQPQPQPLPQPLPQHIQPTAPTNTLNGDENESEFRTTINTGPKVQALKNFTLPNIEIHEDDLTEVKTEYSTNHKEDSDDDDELDSIQQEINFMNIVNSNLGFGSNKKKDIY
ncbi:RabGAP/TBC domain-containing protein [Tieghemostelium lacteum]|uniref:RabGAP/TBC domain-containing protein n=1 Tax=Tieghemostelium lacteum TaxID=361077 RepID=A0A151Z2U1_TIELA|nr:RabGAP/TBC domain-containing protein [Tieghemostelium lacteum]|eukprot:KYQ88275.1 RabGAP/TBC domain-containing protein [Tieghemostelium lacteum]